METKVYAKTLNDIIDANRYSKLIASLGNQLNDRKDRFDKADIIEQSLEVYTNGRLEWVDDIGRDHHDTATGLDLEFKYMANGLFTKTGKPKATIKVKLKNSLGKKLSYFIQVNIGNESQKSGINIKSLDEFFYYCTKDLKLNIIGLMGIPPNDGKENFYFKNLMELNKLLGLKELSMGMSADFKEALEYEATFLRIGSSIFGNRS